MGTAMETVNKTLRRFRVALSFPGEHRSLVESIAEKLANNFGKDKILYDKYHCAELARIDLDTYLQKLYCEESDIVVVFVCDDYQNKLWCNIESRAIRNLINKKIEKERIMPVRCGKGDVDGLYDSVDGYIDSNQYSTDDIARFIIERHTKTVSPAKRYSGIGVGLEIVHSPVPNLRFELVENPNYKGDFRTPFVAEYDIICHNDDQRQYKITIISFVDGQEVICKFDHEISLFVNEQDSNTCHISWFDLNEIERYYNYNKNKEYRIIVNTNGKNYNYKIDLSVFDGEQRNTKRMTILRNDLKDPFYSTVIAAVNRPIKLIDDTQYGISEILDRCRNKTSSCVDAGRNTPIPANINNRKNHKEEILDLYY